VDHLPYGLLLENVDGYKQRYSFRGEHVSIFYNKQTVPKGTLLAALSHEESKATASHFNPFHNYKSMDNMSVTLYCNAHQVYQITQERRDMLLGVRRLEDRLEVLHKLDWVTKLHLGSFVYVTIPSIPVPVRGVVCHIGRLNTQIGTMFGVELMVCVCACVEMSTVHMYSIYTKSYLLLYTVSIGNECEFS